MWTNNTHAYRSSCYLRVLVLCVPDVGTGAHAVVGMVALGFVNPFPAKVLPKVDVQLSDAAGLGFAATGGAKNMNIFQKTKNQQAT